MSTLVGAVLVATIAVLVASLVGLLVQQARERKEILDAWAEERSRLYHLAFANQSPSATPAVVALEQTAARTRQANGRTPAQEEQDALEPVGGVGGY